MIEGIKGKPVHIPGEMKAPVSVIEKAPGTHFYQGGRLKHVGHDGKVYDGMLVS